MKKCKFYKKYCKKYQKVQKFPSWEKSLAPKKPRRRARQFYDVCRGQNKPKMREMIKKPKKCKMFVLTKKY